MKIERSHHRPGPSPRAAYRQWVDACTAAGWHAVAAAEEVPVWDGLGGVTAAPVRARWSFPRSACAAMDGIAVRAGSVAFQAGAPDPWRLPAGSFTWVDTGDPV